MSSPPLLEPGSGATARQGVRDSRRRWWLWAVIAAFVVVEAGVVVAHGAGVTGRLYVILVPVGAATM
ncbi:MAG: hypothetical protein R3320_03080, partial [Nitriliruptorales bacterium]|nr:hypothetical protein [Nitriliruptorales bacterium]